MTGSASGTEPRNSSSNVPPSGVSQPPVMATTFWAPDTAPTAPGRRKASLASNMRIFKVPIMTTRLARACSQSCTSASLSTPSVLNSPTGGGGGGGGGGGSGPGGGSRPGGGGFGAVRGQIPLFLA